LSEASSRLEEFLSPPIFLSFAGLIPKPEGDRREEQEEQEVGANQ
jgi:hypothetical protein